MPKQRKGSESEESQFQEKAANKKTKKVHKDKKSAKKKAQTESEVEEEVKNTPTKQAKKKKKPVEKEPVKPSKPKNEDDDFIIGQKHEMPEDDDGARAFYSSLFQQNPNSEIAKKYCLEYGLMLPDVAQKIYKQLHKKGSA